VSATPAQCFSQAARSSGGSLPDGGIRGRLAGIEDLLALVPPVRPAQAVLTLEALGLLATTGTGGTGMGWRDSYCDSLRGRRVAVLPDNDEAGLRHAERAAGSLILGAPRACGWSGCPGWAPAVTSRIGWGRA
jgi:hypothetical protein